MSNLILQPADMNHYNKTIREFVPLSDIQPFLSNDEVKALQPLAYLWNPQIAPIWVAPSCHQSSQRDPELSVCRTRI